MSKHEIWTFLQDWITALLIAAAIVFTILFFLGCSQQSTITLPPVRAPRIVSPRCAEVAEHIDEMRHWCNSTMIAPHPQRAACRTVEMFERQCL